MTEHVTQWLDAYHDGELRGMHLQRIEAHLAGCDACRAELGSIQALSALLGVPDPQADFLPADRFAANLALHLPRRSQEPQRSRLSLGWWLVPAGLLAVWVFIGITLSLGSALALTADSGLFSGQLAWLGGSPSQAGWVSAAANLVDGQLGGMLREVAADLSATQAFVTRLVRPLLLQALVALAYLGWLLAWWLREQNGALEHSGKNHHTRQY